MKIPVRTKRSKLVPSCCPAGTHPATVLSVVEGGDEEDRYWTVHWEVAPEHLETTFEIEQICDVDEMADIVADLGIAGRRRSLAPDDIRGQALAVIRTFGGGKYAKVVETEPLPKAA